MTIQNTRERRYPRMRAEGMPYERDDGPSSSGGQMLAQGLAWFSLGLGLLELTAPERVARMIGVRDDDAHRSALRAAGLREILSGVGILARPDNPTGWLWARMGGDAMDLALLGGAMKEPDSRRDRLLLATAAVVGVTILDAIASQQQQDGGAGMRALAERGMDMVSGARGRLTRGAPEGIHVHKAITINRPVAEVYKFWHQFENLPRFMSHLESVEMVSSGRTRWTAKGPAGASISWEAETTEDVPNQRISWRSVDGALVENSGTVRFQAAPGDRGTEVHVELRYRPPAGKLGALFAKLFGEAPEQTVRNDLRHFKQVIELGEVVHSDASIHRGPHPGRPAKALEPVAEARKLGENLNLSRGGLS